MYASLINYTLLAILPVTQTGCNQSDKAETSTKTEAATDSLAYRPQYHFSAPKSWINDP